MLEENQEVKRLMVLAMGNLAGIAHRGVVAGSAMEGDYAVIVIGPRDDMAIVTPSSGPVEEKNGKMGPEKPAKVKRGAVKGDIAGLAQQAGAAAIGAAVASTGLTE